MIKESDMVLPGLGTTVFYVEPRSEKDPSPIQYEAALVVRILVDAAGNPQTDLALDLAVFRSDPGAPLAVRRQGVAYHAFKDALTNRGNTWFFPFEARMSDGGEPGLVLG